MDTWLSTLVATARPRRRQQRAHVGTGARGEADDRVRLLLPEHRHDAVDEGHGLLDLRRDPKLAIHASPRQVAGGPRAENILKCSSSRSRFDRLQRDHVHGGAAGPPERRVHDRRLRLDQAGCRPAAAGLAADLRRGPRRRSAAGRADVVADLTDDWADRTRTASGRRVAARSSGATVRRAPPAPRPRLRTTPGRCRPRRSRDRRRGP